MFEKLAQIVQKQKALEDRLADPGLLKDPQILQKLGREHKEVTEIVKVYQEWRGCKQALEEARSLLDEPDPEMQDFARDEVKEHDSRIADLEGRLRRLMLPKDPNDEKNVIVEIRAGTGGEEAALFAADLYRMYTRFAESKGWKVEELSRNESGVGGMREVVALIRGEGAYSRLRFESGTHRVQRVPLTESQGRIHTSAATVAVLPEAEEVEAAHRREGPPLRRLPLFGTRRAERQHDGLGRAGHPLADRVGRHLPGRKKPAQEQGEGDEDPLRPSARHGDPKADGRARGREEKPGGDRRPERADPHLQFSPGPRDGPPHQFFPSQPGKFSSGGDR